MARIRSIKPEFPQSETMGRVSRDARLLFIQLWTICDDAGRARAASRLLASLLYPYDEDAPALIGRWLDELEGVGAIRRYVVGGDTYLDIPKWLKHQKIDRASASRCPAFDEGSPVNRDGSTSPREVSPPDLDLDRDLDREGKGSGRDARASLASPFVSSVNPHSKPTNLVNGAEQRRHGLHAWCNYDRGLCVVYGQHAEFKGRLGTPDAEARLMAWYPTVVERYDGQPVGDRLFEFWANEFAAWVGTVTAKPAPAARVPPPMGDAPWYERCQHTPRCASHLQHARLADAEAS
jgi:hypothetical protein